MLLQRRAPGPNNRPVSAHLDCLRDTCKSGVSQRGTKRPKLNWETALCVALARSRGAFAATPVSRYPDIPILQPPIRSDTAGKLIRTRCALRILLEATERLYLLFL